MFQYLIKEFLIMPFQKFEGKFNYKIGEQLELKFSWIAKIYIDMKAVMKKAKSESYNWIPSTKQKDKVKFLMSEYKEWMKEFKRSGNINNCPSYVYFIGE